MKGLKLIDRRLGFPAGVCGIMEIKPCQEGYTIEVSDWRTDKVTVWSDKDGYPVILATQEEAEACLVRFLEVYTELELGPYPPIPF